VIVLAVTALAGIIVTWIACTIMFYAGEKWGGTDVDENYKHAFLIVGCIAFVATYGLGFVAGATP
jgi:hypothetical protein